MSENDIWFVCRDRVHAALLFTRFRQTFFDHSFVNKLAISPLLRFDLVGDKSFIFAPVGEVKLENFRGKRVDVSDTNDIYEVMRRKNSGRFMDENW